MAAADVLSKKLSRSGVARSPLPDTDLIGETYARGLEDRLRPLVKTMLAAEIAAPRVTRLAEAVRPITAPALIGLIEIEGADNPGLIAFDNELAQHLIDLTLGGDPSNVPDPSDRSLTAIDMSLGRLYLEAALHAFIAALGGTFGQKPTKALRLRDLRQSVGQMRLGPDYIDVLVFRLTLVMAEAGRRGTADLVLPLSALDVIRASFDAQANAAARDRPNDLWKTLMRRAAATAPVPVDAVLHRQTMSLAALQALAVGQVLEIPAESPEAVGLAIAQPGGRTSVVATGALGAYRGRKVVRLAAAPDARLIGHVRRALRQAPRPAPEPQAALPDGTQGEPETALTPPQA
jgi:flagellar motor switch protein FliM